MMNLKSARNSSLRANSLYYADEMEDEDANEDEEVYWSDDYLGIEGKAQDTSKGAEETSERETGGVSDEAVKKQEEPAADSVNSREEEKDAQEPAKSENETANESSISSSDSAESNAVPDTSNENASIPSSSQTLGKASLSKEKRETVLLGAGSAADIISGLTGKGKSLAVIAGQSKKLAEAMSSLMADTSDAAKYSSQLVDNLDMLIEDVTALNDSLDVYYPDFQACLDDTKELVTCTTDALNSSVSTLTIVQNTLKDTSNDFDAAARDSLRGSMELLDKSLNVLDSTASMRHAGRTMKDTMDNELDKFDTENRFLFMEPSAEKISFTSEKNRAPKTLQIVLRTDEISLDDDTAKTADAEAAKAQVSPLRRMWNVLVKLWRAMVSIFKNR